MNIIGSGTLSDSSRHYSDSGTTGFFFNVAPPDYNYIYSVIFDSTTVNGDQTFQQEQIIGTGDLTLVLQNWQYYGGYQVDATTYAGGKWGPRWFDPDYIKYSIWYLNYDSSQFSLIGYRNREPIEESVGNFYAPMEVPEAPGHYQIRWLYFKNDNIGKEVIKAFTSMSRGISAMQDYPFPAGALPYVYENIPQSSTVMAVPVYAYKNLGESAVFTLSLNGTIPPGPYVWRFNGENMVDGPRVSGTRTDTLTLTDLTYAEDGIYTCVIDEQVLSTKAYLIMMTDDPNMPNFFYVGEGIQNGDSVPSV